GLPDFVCKSQCFRSQYAVLGQNCDEMFLCPHDERCNSDPPRLFQDFGEQAVGLSRFSDGNQKIGVLEQQRRDLISGRELAEIDITRLTWLDGFQLFVSEDYVVILLDAKSADNMFRMNVALVPFTVIAA